ncbi:MAG: tonB-system energizer ExbB [Methylovirgula sp.]
MTAYQYSLGNRPVGRSIIAAPIIAFLCLSGLCFSAFPSQAEDATPAASSPKAAAPAPVAPAPANDGAAKAQAAAPSPATTAPAAAAPAPALATTPDAAKPSSPTATAPAEAAAPAAGDAPTKLGNGAPPVPARLLPHELSPWGMFLAADIIVKAVMIGLAFASVVTWTVWLAKSLELFTARRRAQKQLGILASEETLAAAQAGFVGAKGAVAQMVAAAAGELERSADLSPEGIKERAAALIARIEARAGRQMNRGTGALATIGATAPFIGLFGTVWGIMNSFIGISKTNTTNLAVVAPGIAEALLATAIGLVAAIPAVMIYNIFVRSIASYRAALGDAAAEVLRLLSRDLDRAMMEAAEDEGDWRVVGMRQSAE